MSDPAGNQPRDLYDLWFLLEHGEFWLPGLRSGFEEKPAFRGRSAENVLEDIATKEDRLRRLWEQRLARQMSNLLPFDNVFRDVSRQLRSADLDRTPDTPGYPS